MKYFSLIVFAFFLLNCKNEKQEVFDNSTTLSTNQKQTAQAVIDKAIDVAGGDNFNQSTIEFDFRNVHYKAIRNSKGQVLMRSKVDANKDSVRDVISNGKFQRFVNDFPFDVPDSMAVKYSASVNSVHYFSILPFGLNDTAVNKILMEDISVKDKMYHTVKVTFNEDGGGEDFEDVFMYWINKETNKVDYLAYSYNEDDGKGIRFREAYNERLIEGIRFVDYNNYKPKNNSIALKELPQLFERGELKLLSKIELENIAVKLN